MVWCLKSSLYSRLEDNTLVIGLFVNTVSPYNIVSMNLMRSGVCWTSLLSPVQPVISFLHGVAFPSLWSGSAQHLLSHTANSPQIEEQHSFKLLSHSLFSHWFRDFCSSPVKGYLVLKDIGWHCQPMTWYIGIKLMKCGVREHLESLPYQWLTTALVWITGDNTATEMSIYRF